MRRLGRRTHRAGRFADAWFDRTYREWRRKVRWKFLLVVPVVAAPQLVLALIFADYRQFFLVSPWALR